MKLRKMKLELPADMVVRVLYWGSIAAAICLFGFLLTAYVAML